MGEGGLKELGILIETTVETLNYDELYCDDLIMAYYQFGIKFVTSKFKVQYT